MKAVRSLAIDIYDTLQPNAPLSAIEKRVWMLKTRNLPNKTVFRVIKEEYAPDAVVDSVEETDGSAIIVEYLPPEFRRADWR